MAQWYSEHIYPWIVSLILWYIPIFRGRVFVVCRDFAAYWIVSADYIPVDKEESR